MMEPLTSRVLRGVRMGPGSWPRPAAQPTARRKVLVRLLFWLSVNAHILVTHASPSSSVDFDTISLPSAARVRDGSVLLESHEPEATASSSQSSGSEHPPRELEESVSGPESPPPSAPPAWLVTAMSGAYHCTWPGCNSGNTVWCNSGNTFLCAPRQKKIKPEIFRHFFQFWSKV